MPYLFFAVLCGVPLFLLETVIGQYTQEGAITCWNKICPLASGKLGVVLVPVIKSSSATFQYMS